MAKMNLIDKAFYSYFNNRLETSSKKLDFYISYIPIYKQNKLDRIEKRNNEELRKINNSLHNLELQTLSQDDYVSKMVKDFDQKQEEKLYWQKRALIQKQVRASKKDETRTKEQDEAELKELELKFSDARNAYKDKLIAKYSTFDVESAKIELASKKESLLSDFELKKESRLEKANLQNETFEAKTEIKIEKLKNKIENLESKVKSYNEGIAPESISSEDHLVIQGLTMQFGGLRAVDSLSFTVKKGEIFGLIGPNGAGKTTAFNCITQFYKPTEGEVYYSNKLNEVIRLNDLSVHNVIKKGIVRTFQNLELVYELNVLDNLLVGAHSLYRTGFFQHIVHTAGFRREEEVLRNKAIQILSDLGIAEYMYAYPIGLPYGVLKKIELARTLMTEPELIILDEPAAGLNDIETKDLAQTIKRIRDEYECTIFLVEHDMGLVMEICDTICAISFGKMLAIGKPEEIRNNKVVQEAYLGGE